METSLCVRLFLLMFSVISLSLQITSIILRSWFGFSIGIHGDGKVVTQELIGGLFLTVPDHVCVAVGNTTVCNDGISLTPSEYRTLKVAETLVSQGVNVSKILVLGGVASSTFGFIFLYCYLCLSKTSNKQRCVGALASMFWIFAAFPELTAIGVQMFANLTLGATLDIIKDIDIKGTLDIQLITPWALIALCVGVFFNLIVATIVALPSCGEKEVHKKVLLYNKRPRGYKDKFRILDNEDDEYDSDL